MSVDFTETEAPIGEIPPEPAPPGSSRNGTKSKGKTTIGRGPGRPPKSESKGDSEPMTPATLRGGLYGFFSTIAMVMRADVDWQERDFEQMARGIMIAGKRVPQLLVVVMNIMTPALALREFLMKLNDLRNGVLKRKQQEQPEQQPSPPIIYPPGTGNAGHTGA